MDRSSKFGNLGKTNFIRLLGDRNGAIDSLNYYCVHKKVADEIRDQELQKIEDLFYEGKEYNSKQRYSEIRSLISSKSHYWTHEVNKDYRDLSVDMWIILFSYLDLVELSKSGWNRICKSANIALSNQELWKKECQKVGFYMHNNPKIHSLWRTEFIDYFLSKKEQENAINTVVESRYNVFITGGAGVGKSYVIHEIKKRIKKKTKAVTVYIQGVPQQVERPLNLIVTASTGAAAVQIGGSTIHSWSKIPWDNDLNRSTIFKVMMKYKDKEEIISRYQSADILIIDEISLLSIDYFENLDYVARNIRQNDLPFGGIQVVLVGDFLQLPPVAGNGSEVRFCFESDIWKKSIGISINMNHSHRQKDSTFVSLLNRVRKGEPTKEDETLLRSRLKANLDNPSGIVPTVLYSTRDEAKLLNDSELSKLNGETRTFITESGSEVIDDTKRKQVIDQMMDSYNVQQRITLKTGTQVIILRNLDKEHGIMNGSRGVVTGFCDPNSPHFPCPIIKFSNGYSTYITPSRVQHKDPSTKKKTWIKNLFIGHGWATTIHKSQGMTLDFAYIHLGSIFSEGMAYVALSRIRSIQNLGILGYKEGCIKANKKVINFYKSLEESQKRKFSGEEGKSNRRLKSSRL
jgi:ATP-dependent DNA helicase PIF1